MIAYRHLPLACLWLSILSAACTALQRPPAPLYPDLVVTLERGPCFGSCPVYKLTIDGRGKVIYEGEMSVTTTGRRESSISQKRIQELVAAFEKASYFSLADHYEVYMTDLPAVRTSITMGGKTKSIYHYGAACGESVVVLRLGDQKMEHKIDYHAPKELCELEAAIEEIANAKQWVAPPLTL